MRRFLGRTPPSDPAASSSFELAPAPRVRDLLQTLPGRLFVLSLALLLLLVGVQQFATVPNFVLLFRKVVSAALLVSGIWLLVLVLPPLVPHLLWSVRRKLILSYLLLGVVPVVLIGVFVLLGGWIFYTNVAAYMFHDTLTDFQAVLAEAVAGASAEIAQTPTAAPAILERRVATLAAQYPSLSLAVIPSARAGGPAAVSAGPWRHARPPRDVPPWVATTRAFSGVLVPDPADAGAAPLVLRAFSSPAAGSFLVIGDLPIDDALMARLEERSAMRIATVADSRLMTSFQRTMASVNEVTWSTGATSAQFVNLEAPIGRLYDRIVRSGQLVEAAGGSRTVDFLFILPVFGGLLLVVQGSALFFGALLISSITSAVHELLAGTERIRRGDFSHKITIESRDQLGQLTESYNLMSASVVHLLHVQREKQRLDDELRIAHDIQKSLMPIEAPHVPGLDVAALWNAARGAAEPAGDYYDFFAIGPRQLGVLVADVSGKGISAALYMAELKGLMLALSHAERSPRKLLIDVNRRLAGQLDNRSFITMTYAIVDLDAGTLTCARAGHTPLVLVTAGESHVVAPDGMVLGLSLPGAGAKFEQVLAEDTRRIGPGDVIVLYTDGITEAMDTDGELFGDAALANVLSTHHRLDAAGLRERLVREVEAFVGEAEQHDDMIVVVMKITGDCP